MDKIYLLIGNDTPLAVCLRKSEGEETPVPYDLSEARHLRLTLVGHGMRVCAKDIEVSGDDDNVVSGMIPGRSLLKGDYDLEVTFTIDGRDKRFAVEDMFEAVDFLAEDADGEAEGEGAGIWVNVTVQPEVIEIAGPTGPKGDTPVLTADEDGTIYADGVLLTEVVKDVTEAVESAERSRVTAESQRVAAESARVSAETARETQASSDHTRAETDHTRAEEAAAAAEHMVDIKQGPQGPQGNTGSSVDYPYELVNNLTTDDATKGLSAAQGVVLDGKVSQLRSDVGGIEAGDTSSYQLMQGYISKTGVVTSNNYWQYSTPIHVSKGATMTIVTAGNDVCLIAQYINGTYTPLLNIPLDSDSTTLHTYTYTFQTDMYVSVSLKVSVAGYSISLDGRLDLLTEEMDGLFEYTVNDYAVADKYGNNLLVLRGGHIKTKNFDSSKLPIPAINKAVFMGDSITQGVYSYWNNNVHDDANRFNGFDIINPASVEESTAYNGIHHYFAEFAGCDIVNLAKRGTGYVADTRNLGNALEVATDYDFSDVDFVGLFFGVNDYIQGSNIGTIGASGTVRGNLAGVIQKIASDNPLCKIVVYSPYNTFGQVSKGGDYIASGTLYGDETTNYALGYDLNGEGTLGDYVSAIDDVCAFYGVQHVKLSESNVVNRLTIKNIMIDGLHPSKEAYPKLAAEIYGKGNYGA